MKMTYRLIAAICLAVMAWTFGNTQLMAQTKNDRWHIRQGNREFHKGRVDEAATHYKMALAKDSLNPQAVYNLGCASLQKALDMLQEGQSENGLSENSNKTVDSLFHKSDSLFRTAAKLQTNKLRKAMSWHNVGVMYQMAKQWPQAIEAYKEALRNNPHDDETRYNLALCMWQNKKNQDQNQDQNQGQGQNQDQDQDKDQDKKDDQNKQDSQQDQKPQQDQQQQKEQQQPRMSRENIERLLDAAKQQEKETQEKLQNATQLPRRRKLEKNW